MGFRPRLGVPTGSHPRARAARNPSFTECLVAQSRRSRPCARREHGARRAPDELGSERFVPGRVPAAALARSTIEQVRPDFAADLGELLDDTAAFQVGDGANSRHAGDPVAVVLELPSNLIQAEGHALD